jgi:hypothetical protein
MGHRTQITLTDDQYERLREESARSGLGLAELVRRAVDRSYGTVSGPALLAVLDETFGRWTDGDDGAHYVDSLRRGMGRRLGDG